MKRFSSSLVVVAVVSAVAACSSPASNSTTPPVNTTQDTGTPSLGAIGAACTDAAACASGECNAEWPGGYCTKAACDATSCGDGSTCFLAKDGSTSCHASCTDRTACREGYACAPTGACVPACTADSCTEGFTCNAESGNCVAENLEPTPGPMPLCAELPERDCKGTGTECGEILPFEPTEGVGYENYPLNGETKTDQYRSFCRKDLQLLVKYAAAYVDCKAKSWPGGNGKPLGLGDMSEKDGSIPGTRESDPGHPAGTHVKGFDMDIGYYQTKLDNKLRPICEHATAGKEAYHCTKEPHLLDVWRQTLFLGAFLTSARVRVIGVDGKVGAILEKAMPRLCAQGWLPQQSCKAATKLAYEVTDEGAGWYLFHHHHFHVSLKPWSGSSGFAPLTLMPEGGDPSKGIEMLKQSKSPGHGFIALP